MRSGKHRLGQAHRTVVRKESNMRQVFWSMIASFGLLSAGLAQNAVNQNSPGQPANVPAYQQPTPAQQQEIEQNLKDVRFAFDRFDLTPEDNQSLQATANWLKANPEVFITIAGDADERGSISYNLYLSDQRAKTVREALIRLGVP